MRRTRRAGCAAAATAATNTMAELSPRAGTDQGENPGSFDATISAAGNAIARPRAKPPAASFRPLARTAPMIWRGAAPRAIRRDGNEAVKQLAKDKKITEDDDKKAHDEIQKLTNTYMDRIDTASKTKEKDILEIR